MATRCCSPPESSDGRWLARSASPTRSSASSVAVRRCRSVDPRVVAGEHHVLERGQDRDQVEVLEDEAHLTGSDPRSLPITDIDHVAAIEGQLRARAVIEVGGVQQAQDVHERALPRSRRPHDRHHLAGGDRYFDASKRLDLIVPAELVRLAEGAALSRSIGRSP